MVFLLAGFPSLGYLCVSPASVVPQGLQLSRRRHLGGSTAGLRPGSRGPWFSGGETEAQPPSSLFQGHTQQTWGRLQHVTSLPLFYYHVLQRSTMPLKLADNFDPPQWLILQPEKRLLLSELLWYKMR